MEVNVVFVSPVRSVSSVYSVVPDFRPSDGHSLSRVSKTNAYPRADFVPVSSHSEYTEQESYCVFLQLGKDHTFSAIQLIVALVQRFRRTKC